MANGLGIETPANKLATALATFSLACRLSGEVNAKRIDKSIFARGVHIRTGGPGLRLPPYPEGTTADLEAGIENIVLIALYASALSADETLKDVFGELSTESDANRRGIRMMVSQLRNAFAHNPWRPRWVIFEQHRKTYPITLDDGSTFTFDARNLNGDGVKADHVGGLEFWTQVLQHCERVLGRKK